MAIVVEGRTLEQTGGSSWFTVDRQLLIGKYEDGWHIRPVNQDAMKALREHGWKSSTTTGLNFRESIALGAQLTGCTTHVIKAPTRYLIVDTPLTLMRYGKNQWTITLTPGWGPLDHVWQAALDASVGILHPTRSATIRAMNQVIDAYDAQM